MTAEADPRSPAWRGWGRMASSCSGRSHVRPWRQRCAAHSSDRPSRTALPSQLRRAPTHSLRAGAKIEPQDIDRRDVWFRPEHFWALFRSRQNASISDVARLISQNYASSRQKGENAGKMAGLEEWVGFDSPTQKPNTCSARISLVKNQYVNTTNFLFGSFSSPHTERAAYRIYPCIRRTFLSQNWVRKVGVRLTHRYEITVILMWSNTRKSRQMLGCILCMLACDVYMGEYGNSPPILLGFWCAQQFWSGSSFSLHCCWQFWRRTTEINFSSCAFHSWTHPGVALRWPWLVAICTLHRHSNEILVALAYKQLTQCDLTLPQFMQKYKLVSKEKYNSALSEQLQCLYLWQKLSHVKCKFGYCFYVCAYVFVVYLQKHFFSVKIWGTEHLAIPNVHSVAMR